VKILFTGASSFTGYWCVKELAAQGHEIVAAVRGAENSYSEIRAARIANLSKAAEIVWSCPFGEADFLRLTERAGFDLLCHHAARVADYRNPNFDALGAAEENTRSLPPLLRAMRDRGLKGLVLTGSVFEQDEGVGSAPMRAFSPYGLSKGITAQIARYWCETLGIPMGKFVIPNPFGILEEPRFCAYLVKCWKAGEPAEVRTPHYVRDNIHVSLLAKSYAWFARQLANDARGSAFHPSGYVESQGAFAERVAHELGPRLGLECRVALAVQTDFSEPLVRINTTPASSVVTDWNEPDTWDTYAEYYR
jgi:nucleoside-diphosphate-sugar epimerase